MVKSNKKAGNFACRNAKVRHIFDILSDTCKYYAINKWCINLKVLTVFKFWCQLFPFDIVVRKPIRNCDMSSNLEFGRSKFGRIRSVMAIRTGKVFLIILEYT